MMKKITLTLSLLGCLAVQTTIAQVKPALTWKDVSKWTYNRSSTLSADGQWTAWATGPTEGDLKLVIKKTFDTLTHSYAIGATPNTATFSKNSKYAAFKVSAKDAEVKAAKKSFNLGNVGEYAFNKAGVNRIS